MNKTPIDWVKNPDGTQGYAWNPITGCLNGCPYCYARKLANGRLKQRYLANTNLAPNAKGGVCKLTIGDQKAVEREGDYADPFYPRLWESRLEPVGLTGGDKRPHSYGHLTCYKDHKPKGIFVCDMSDLFGIGIPEDWTHRVMDTIKKCPGHRFYLLTKQPQNLIKFSPFPDNCWVGVTITSSGERTLHNMVKVEAKLKFISFEPLLEWRVEMGALVKALQTAGIGWVIIGAQTKPYKPPKIEWVEEIVRACDKAGIPVFLKDNLLELVNYQSPKTAFAFNKEGYYRQEMPK